MERLSIRDLGPEETHSENNFHRAYQECWYSWFYYWSCINYAASWKWLNFFNIIQTSRHWKNVQLELSTEYYSSYWNRLTITGALSKSYYGARDLRVCHNLVCMIDLKIMFNLSSINFTYLLLNNIGKDYLKFKIES